MLKNTPKNELYLHIPVNTPLLPLADLPKDIHYEGTPEEYIDSYQIPSGILLVYQNRTSILIGDEICGDTTSSRSFYGQYFKDLIDGNKFIGWIDLRDVITNYVSSLTLGTNGTNIHPVYIPVPEGSTMNSTEELRSRYPTVKKWHLDYQTNSLWGYFV